MIQASAHSAVIRRWPSYYLVLTVVSTLQERVDYAIVRGFFRLLMTAIAATLGKPPSPPPPPPLSPTLSLSTRITWSCQLSAVDHSLYIESMIYDQNGLRRASMVHNKRCRPKEPYTVLTWPSVNTSRIICFAGSFIMLRPRLVDGTYGLMALTCICMFCMLSSLVLIMPRLHERCLIQDSTGICCGLYPARQA